MQDAKYALLWKYQSHSPGSLAMGATFSTGSSANLPCDEPEHYGWSDFLQRPRLVRIWDI